MDICQSCGMPLKNEEDFGTNENGSKNIEIAINMGISEDKAREMANNTIPILKRWKNS
jgi:hypothetical protein